MILFCGMAFIIEFVFLIIFLCYFFLLNKLILRTKLNCGLNLVLRNTCLILLCNVVPRENPALKMERGDTKDQTERGDRME